MSANTTIYVGFWTNWSKGAIVGSTLTLSKSNGAILVAAIAIFIQLAGGHSWNIICFATHQLRTTMQARDGIYHQQQALLRSGTSDLNTIWNFVKVSWAWRRFKGSFAPISVGVLHLLAFGAASILASHITTVDNEVLVARSPNCGPWGPLPRALAADLELMIVHQSYSTAALEASREYVLDCITEPQSLPECDNFKTLQINWTSTNTPCPFDGLCLGPANNSLYMDTGLVDSREHLGINAKDQDRVQIRRNATCVPITTEGYTTHGSSYTANDTNYSFNSHTSQPSTTAFNYTALFYGPTTRNMTNDFVPDPALENITYLYTNFRDVATEIWNNEVSPYDLHVEMAVRDGGFRPLSAFHATNKSLSLIFASFYGTYLAASDDVWLSAHQGVTTAAAVSTEAGNSAPKTTFRPDNLVSVLACTEQFQLCNPSPLNNATATCTPWLDSLELYDASREEIAVLDTDRQWNTANALINAYAWSSIYNVIAELSTPLLAESLTSGASVSLPLVLVTQGSQSK